MRLTMLQGLISCVCTVCATLPADANHRYMSINNDVSSSVAGSGKATWDPGDPVTVSGQLRTNGGVNCGNTGALASLSSFDVTISAPQSGLGNGQHACGGNDFTVSPGTDGSGNFAFAMQGGGVSWTTGDGVNDPGSIVTLEFTVSGAAKILTCGDGSTYAALGSGACASAPEIYGVMSSPDLNGDGDVDASDLPLLGGYLGDPITLNWAWQMDYNHDGYADAGDVGYWGGRSTQTCSLSKVTSDYDMDVAGLESPGFLDFIEEHNITIAQILEGWDNAGLSYDHEAAENLGVTPPIASAVERKSWSRVKTLYRD